MLLWTVYLMPLAFYLVHIGQQYQLGRPRVLSGHSDLARLFGALSGMVLIGGPRLLAQLHHKWTLLELTVGPTPSWYLGRGFWSFLLSLYALTVVGIAAWLWRKRSGVSIVFPADLDLVQEATLKAGVGERFEIVEDKTSACVEIRWVNTPPPGQAAAERELGPILDLMRVNSGWIWIVPVGFGLGLLGFLATLNLGTAFWVFRSQ